MRKFQRAAIVMAAMAGLSVLGTGASFAGENDAPPSISAVANSSANAVAVGGGYYVTPQGQPEEQSQAQPQEEQSQGEPQEEQKSSEPEQGYGEHGEHGEDK
ncbi:hypothetical protein ABZ467_12490 [Streptomyces sp. NPDC005727]|uniref:hypothetical protein n=1 Tax=Streptomyces sp. NPDC005727 TaxID=3157053 RepID=UPI0033CDEABF